MTITKILGKNTLPNLGNMKINSCEGYPPQNTFHYIFGQIASIFMYI